MFVFGSQYLRGMTPPPADWRRDLQAMAEAGFNTVRAWLVWGVMEPRRGEIDFNYLDEFLDLAERAGLRAGLLLHLHGAPEWACGQFPQFWYVNSRGRAFEPSQRANTPSGGWPGLCPDHAEVRDMEAAFIEPVVDRFADHPAVAFWEPMNEPHMWVDLAEDPPGEFCYCPATREAFRGWLSRRYGSLGELERAWGRRFGQWSDVRPPTWRFGFSDWADWRTFAAESVAAHVARRAELIRRHWGGPVIAHSWGGSCLTCPHLGAMAFDDWKNAAAVDLWGYSAFPHSPDQMATVGLGTDATRAAAGGKEFWQSELGAGDLGAGLHRGGRIRPEIEALFCWESIRHGAKGLLFWQYRKEAHGAEFGAHGLTDYAGGQTPTLRAVADVGRTLNAHADLFAAADVRPADVAILFSYRSFMAEWAQARNNRLGVDSLSGTYRIFWDANIPVDFLHEEYVTAESLGRYRLVALPMPVALVGRVRPLLAEYVRGGGTVLSDPYLCAFNADLSLAREVPGGSLVEVFGCREADITTVGDKPVELAVAGRRLSVAGGHFRASWELLAGAEVVASYADGTPAVVANAYGSGRAIIAGVNLGLSAAGGHTLADDVTGAARQAAGAAGAELVLSLAGEAGVRSPVATPPDVRAGVLSAPDGRCVLIALNLADAPRAGQVRLEGVSFKAAEDLLGGAAPTVGQAALTLAFGPYESKVLLLR